MLTVIGATAEASAKAIARADVVANIRWREPWRDASLVSVEEHHQAARITIRQWSKQHAVHDRKDRRRRADAERQGQNRHAGERGLPSQEPPRMTQVPKQEAQQHPPRRTCLSRDERPAIRLTSLRRKRLTASVEHVAAQRRANAPGRRRGGRRTLRRTRLAGAVFRSPEGAMSLASGTRLGPYVIQPFAKQVEDRSRRKRLRRPTHS